MSKHYTNALLLVFFFLRNCFVWSLVFSFCLIQWKGQMSCYCLQSDEGNTMTVNDEKLRGFMSMVYKKSSFRESFFNFYALFVHLEIANGLIQEQC